MVWAYLTLTGDDHGVLAELDQHQVLQLLQVSLVRRVHTLIHKRLVCSLYWSIS